MGHVCNAKIMLQAEEENARGTVTEDATEAAAEAVKV